MKVIDVDQKTKGKTKGSRIFPISIKIIFIFILFILASNFSSHYISLMWNKKELIKLSKDLLVNDLKALYSHANTQKRILDAQLLKIESEKDDKKKELLKKEVQKKSIVSIEKKAIEDFKEEKKRSIFIGIKKNGEIIILASKLKKQYQFFSDKQSLKQMIDKKDNGVETFIKDPKTKKITKKMIKLTNDSIQFQFNDQEYIGIYKYNEKWEAFLIRAEELDEFFKNTNEIFKNISIIILGITFICAILGVILMKYILRFLKVITQAVLKMTKNKELSLIPLKKAPADDITFLGVAFNSLSSTISSLLNIFRKFTNKDIVIKAYRDRYIKLEGSRRELTCLFSDIKSFTYMTEVLGTDIITLLNLHYTKAINAILDQDGIIGSIIGDALLAVYGALDDSTENKSYQSIVSSYQIQVVAKNIRDKMISIRDEIIKERGSLTPNEEKVYKAVLIEVGVGIDGGLVFYGNIGSYERMTNTVIGDNVNSSSRLEGLTRVYKIPVICSNYVKEDIENNVKNHGLTFVELDQVQVKGKTIGKKVYWPIFDKDIDKQLQENIDLFNKALPLYYEGEWEKANEIFIKIDHVLADVFKERTETKKAPKGWNGIWAMTTK